MKHSKTAKSILAIAVKLGDQETLPYRSATLLSKCVAGDKINFATKGNI
jgi:hypothetical protein